MKTRYELKSGDGWIRVSKATTSGMKSGWLHYELKEGGSLTIGLAAPGKWREMPGKKENA